MYLPNSRFHTELVWQKVEIYHGIKSYRRRVLNLERIRIEIQKDIMQSQLTAILSNIYYNNNGLKQRILVEERNLKQIFPEEILNTVLESDQVDAIFAYKHEAISRSLPYITLPLQVNLGNHIFCHLLQKCFVYFL